MKFICENCNYTTDVKYCYEKHLTTKKHLEKTKLNFPLNPCSIPIESENHEVKKVIQTKKILSYDCRFCDNSYSTASNLSKHLKNCLLKKQLVDNFVQKEKDMKKEIEELRKDIAKEIAHRHDVVSVLTVENKNMKILLNNASNIMDKSISAYNYINKYYPDAPTLEYITDIPALDEELSEDKVVDTIMSQYRNETLVSFIGDIIIKNYKKEDPKEQSIWNSDVDRLTYMIKTIINDNNSQWAVDKKGLDTIKQIIEPILRFIRKHMMNYVRSYKLAKRSDSTEKIMNVMDDMRDLNAVITSIENGYLSNSILKYMAPRLYVIKDQQLFL